MRILLDTVAMDGVVVIGEGEKDEAPMLYNGEQIGDGSLPAGGHRRGSARGHRAVRQGAAQRDRHDRPLRARHDVRPRPVRLHAEDGHVARPGPPARPRPPARGDAAADGEGEGRGGGRPRGDHARPPASRRRHEGDPRRGGPHQADPARRRLGGAGRCDRGIAGRPALRHRRHPRGRARRGGDQVHRRADPGPAVAALGRGARRGPGGRLRPRRGARPRPAGVRQGRVLRRHRRHGRRDAGRRALHRCARAPPRSRSRCAPARAPCARSPLATTGRSCGRSWASASG